jgi:hypothetical protein
MDTDNLGKIDDLLEEMKAKKSVVDNALDLIEEVNLSLLLDQLNQPYCILPGKLINAVPIKSIYFVRWLRGAYFDKYKKGLSGNNIDTIVATLEGKAVSQDSKEVLYNRWAYVDDEIYFDKGDWQQIIHITKNGWSILEESAIHFRKFAHHETQVDPSQKGDLKLLLKYTNLISHEQELLLLCHLPAICFPDHPRACLICSGSAGAAKTTLLRLILGLIDPSKTDVLRFQNDPKEIAQQAWKHYCLFYDNLSYLKIDLSDFLCTVVTGLSYSKRQLFSDDGDTLWNIKCSLGLSGVTLVPTRSDLLSRSLILNLESIPEEKRLPESVFWKNFEQDKPKILAGLFDVLSKVLASGLTLDKLPRMADYALVGTKAAIALGYTSDDYLNAYSNNVKRQNDTVIEASPLAQTIIVFMQELSEWQGSSSILYGELFEIAERLNLYTKGHDDDGFPKASTWLWRKMVPIRPNLLELGIRVNRSENKSGSLIQLSKVIQNAANAATDSQEEEDDMATVAASQPTLDSSLVIKEDFITSLQKEDHIES